MIGSLHPWTHVPRCSAESASVPFANKGLSGINFATSHVPRGVRCVYNTEQRLWPTHSSSTSLAALGPSADSVEGQRRPREIAVEDDDHSLSRGEVDRRVRKASNLMKAGDELAPFDRRTFNPALVLW